MAYGQIAAAALSAAGQASSSAPGVSSLRDRSPIHIAPTGVNLGSILEPYTQGSPENGGYAIKQPSRYIPSKQSTDADFVTADLGDPANGDDPLFPFALIAVGGAVLFVVVKKIGG